MELMMSPFLNDPFAMVYQAYQKLYGKPFRAYYDLHGAEDEDEDGEAYGYTEFAEGESPVVIIYANYPISQRVEILAHELAHIAAGKEHEHDEVWKAAFDAISQEYGRLGRELTT